MSDTTNAEHVRAEYHSHPSPHFVFDEATWEQIKASPSPSSEFSRIAGQVGSFASTPVYIDDCPSLWACSRAQIDGSGGGDE